MTRILILAVALSLCWIGCGDDDGMASTPDAADQDTGTVEECPNLTGTWTIDEHCGGAAVIGMSVPVTQDGCTFTTGGAFAGFTGVLDADGDFTMTGVSNGQTVNCTGTATSTLVTENCNGDCDVVMTK